MRWTGTTCGFGTSEGLNRYDKTIDSWAVRTRKDGLVSKVITTIAVEPEYVWVGTGRETNPDPHGWDEDPRFSRGGVSRYHRDTDSWNNYTKSDGLIDSEIATIAVDDDSVWFGTQKEGVSQYNQVDQAFIKTYTKTDLLKSNIISCIRADGFQVWFGTANAGVHRFIKPVNTWVHYTQADGLTSNHVSWITTQGNDVWFASKEDGVSRFDKVSGEWTIYKQADFLADNDVRYLTRDPDGNLWLATVAGISVYSPQTRNWEIISKKDGLPTPYITSIDFAKEAINDPPNNSQPSVSVRQEAISNQQEGIDSPEASLLTAGRVAKQPDLMADRQHAQVWIGSDRGLGTRAYLEAEWTFHVPPRTQTQGEAFVTSVDAGTASQNHRVWVGTSFGPAVYDTTSQEWTQLTLPDTPKNPLILAVLAHNEKVWFGGAEGVLQYSIADKRMHRVADGLPNPYVNVLLSTDSALQTDPTEQTLWAGTRRGLARYDKTRQRWVPLSFNDQLPSPNITALAFQDGTLWIGTPQGLGSYTIASDSWNSLSNVPYNIRDILCDADGTLWLATDTGLVEYDSQNGREVLHQSRPVREPFLETRVLKHQV